MDNRNWATAAVATPPTPEASPSSGYPVDGDPNASIPATEPGAYWFHQIGEELRQVVIDGGLIPSDADLTQLSVAIQALITAAIPAGEPDASETVKGIIEIATAAEAQALSSLLLALTPGGLNAAFQGGNQLLAASGYQKLPGGLIFQWGTVSANHNTVVMFPQAFPTACYGVYGNDLATSATTLATLGMDAITTTGFTILAQLNGTNTNPGQLDYFAIGR